MSKPMTAAQYEAQMKKWGVPAIYWPGWKTRGRPADTAGGPMVDVNGIVIHHTGSDSQADSYVRWLFEQGRPGEGIPAPLAQVMTSMAGKLIVGALGKANHAGNGVKRIFNKVVAETISMTSEEAPGSTGTMNGNPRFYGNEVMFDGGQPMTQPQYLTVILWCAAICDFHKWSGASVIGHGEWTSAKWDPGQTDMAKLRRDVNAALQAGPGKTDPTPEEPKPIPITPSTYAVKKGDTLTSISKKFKVSVTNLVDWNKVKDPNKLSVGQVLKLKKPAAPKRVKKLSDYKPSDFGPGKVGPQITLLGQRLIAHGFGKHYRVGPGPRWGNADELNLTDYQLSRWPGASTKLGGDADGLPGVQSLVGLTANPKDEGSVVKFHQRIGQFNLPGPDKISNDTARAKKAAELIKASKLDVVGFNELVGPGKDSANNAPSSFAKKVASALGVEWQLIVPTTAYNENYIAIRKAKIQLVTKATDQKIYAKDGSRAIPGRHVTRTILRDKPSGFEFGFGETHLVNGDEKGAAAQAPLVMSAMKATAGSRPIIIAGDMNTHATLSGFTQGGLKNSRTSAKATISAKIATYVKYSAEKLSTSANWIIDQIYVDGDLVVDGYTVVTDLGSTGKFNKPRASDHLLVIIAVSEK